MRERGVAGRDGNRAFYRRGDVPVAPTSFDSRIRGCPHAIT
jgi:hypothetical protein